jgi:hypothetical protein
MPVIVLTISIDAPIDVVFDLARSIDLHLESTAQTNERAVAGRTTGLIGLGEEVTWEATHFGIRQRLTSKITQFDRPRTSATRWCQGHSSDSITTTTSSPTGRGR